MAGMKTHRSTDAGGQTATDMSPLAQQPTRDEVAAFRRETDAAEAGSRREATASSQSVVWAVALAPLLALGTVGTVFSLALPFATPLIPAMVVAGILLVISVALLFVAVRGWRERVHFRNEWSRRLRLARFAAANGLVYGAEVPALALPGSIFAPSLSPSQTDRMVAGRGRAVALGTVRYHPLTSPACVFLGVRLDDPPPNTVLKSKSARRHAPALLRGRRRAKLEGDLGRRFRLYVPQNTRGDAPLAFAPELVAVLVGEAPSVEVEVVDDWIFFYAPAAIDLAEPETMRRFMRILDAVGREQPAGSR